MNRFLQVIPVDTHSIHPTSAHNLTVPSWSLHVQHHVQRSSHTSTRRASDSHCPASVSTVRAASHTLRPSRRSRRTLRRRRLLLARCTICETRRRCSKRSRRALRKTSSKASGYITQSARNSQHEPGGSQNTITQQSKPLMIEASW